jgi:hypothetical protein
MLLIDEKNYYGIDGDRKFICAFGPIILFIPLHFILKCYVRNSRSRIIDELVGEEGVSNIFSHVPYDLSKFGKTVISIKYLYFWKDYLALNPVTKKQALYEVFGGDEEMCNSLNKFIFILLVGTTPDNHEETPPDDSTNVKLMIINNLERLEKGKWSKKNKSKKKRTRWLKFKFLT